MKYRMILPCLICCCFAVLIFEAYTILQAQETPPPPPATDPQPAEQPPAPPAEQPPGPEPETPNFPAPPRLQIPPEKMTFPLSLQVLSYNTYAQLAAQADAKDGGNFCFSPQLLAKQLTVLRFGADGQAAAEVLGVFPARATVPQTAEYLRQVEAGAAKLREGMQHPQAVPTFGQANAVWVPADHPIVEEYITGIQTGLSTNLYAADFQNQRDAAATVVNAWARDMSGGRLTSVIAEPYEATLPGDVSVVTTGLVCAAPRMAVPFNRKFSGSNEFQLASGEKIAVPMMRVFGQFQASAITDLQVLVMPCFEENLQLVILLPAAGQLKTLENAMTPEFLMQRFAQLQPVSADVIMPQLKMTSCLDLAETLKGMGLSTMTSESADFSNLSQTDEKGPLRLSKLMHETQMTLAEQLDNPQQQIPQTQWVPFYVNRPFVFLIWNSASGTPLVIGRVTNPQL